MEMRRNNNRNPAEPPKPMGPPAGAGRANLTVKPIPANQGNRPMQAAPNTGMRSQENKPEQQPASMPNMGNMSSRSLGNGRAQNAISVPNPSPMQAPVNAPAHTNINRPMPSPMAAPNANRPMQSPMAAPNAGDMGSRYHNNRGPMMPGDNNRPRR